MWHDGFQPTYEELKLGMRIFVAVSSGKFSAYLRGIETDFQLDKGLSQIKFSAYLRGIETPLNVLNAGALIWFSAYLRGIETHYAPQ